MGRQHQGMDGPGVRQVPEGSGEQGKMEKTDCKIIYGAPATLAVKGLMVMMNFYLQARKMDLAQGLPKVRDVEKESQFGYVYSVSGPGKGMQLLSFLSSFWSLCIMILYVYDLIFFFF